MTDTLNADFTARAVMDTNAMDWAPSPSPTVWRKRLDLIGGEHGRVTSVVRYDPGAAFPAHDHPDGEEILVLEGTFSDEHGDYPAGTYLLNPPGFRHAPFSREGCVIFVKLYQYAGDGRQHLAIDTEALEWQAAPLPGAWIKPLYADDAHPERMVLVRVEPGATSQAHDHPGGEEIFVLDGAIEDEFGHYPAGTWLRQPPGSRHAPWSREGCKLYVKLDHLADAAGAPGRAA